MNTIRTDWPLWLALACIATAGVLILVNTGCATSHGSSSVAYDFPARYEAECQAALDRARACILSHGGTVTERSCRVVLRPCDRKVGAIMLARTGGA